MQPCPSKDSGRQIRKDRVETALGETGWSTPRQCLSHKLSASRIVDRIEGLEPVEKQLSTVLMMHAPSLPAALDKACRNKRAEQRSRIPQDWVVKSPPEQVTNVLDIPTQCGTLSPFEIEVTELDDVDELLDRLATGKWSCVDVTRAYCKRAVIAHQLVSSST